MKKYYSFFLVFLFLNAVVIFPSYAEQSNPAKISKRESNEEVFSAILDKQKPTPQMAQLSGLIGTWSYTLTYGAEGESDPQISSGFIENEIILSGRILKTTSSLFLHFDGNLIPYEFISFVGYDSAAQHFTSYWMDTVNDGIVLAKGQYDEKNGIFEENGTLSDPVTDTDYKFKSITKIIDADHYTKELRLISSKNEKAFVIIFAFNRS